MKIAQKHPDEEKRLQSVKALNILDSLPEKDFDQIVQIAAQICGTPIALISIIDENRQWFKAKVGLSATETSRDLAFCAHAILQDKLFVVEDSSKDERFFDNPLVTSGPCVQFYAGAPLLSPDGYPIGTLCVIDNKSKVLSEEQSTSLLYLSNQITRLLQLNTKVKELEEVDTILRLKSTAVDTIAEGIVIQIPSGAIIDFNSAALTLLELSADELTGKSSFDPLWHAIREDGSVFPGHEHPAMVCLKTGQKQVNVIMGIKSRAIETRWLKINSVPMLSLSGKIITHAVTSFADITDRVIIQKNIEKTRDNLRFILDSVPHLIGHWGSDLINLDSNRIYSEYFGTTPEEIRGIHIKELLGPEVYSTDLVYINKVLTGEKVQFERTLQLPDGRTRFVLAAYIPNVTNGMVQSFLAIVIDITDLKNLETERRYLEAQLSESSRLATLGEMASGMAHEINNPLTIIAGKASVLKSRIAEIEIDGELCRKDIDSILITVERIARIIKSLRTYSRNADNDPFETSNILQIIENTLFLCEARFKKFQVSFSISCDSSLIAQCRPPQITQILMNLLSNSFDAIENQQEKWINVIAIEKDQETITLKVTDSGHGINPEVAKKIMEPFFTTKDVGKGTGLGLSISSGIAGAHGGILRYDPSEKNTTFILELPKSHLT